MTRRDSKEKPGISPPARGGDGGAAASGTGGPRQAGEQVWGVYVVRCRDGSLYTGCTNRLKKRLADHDSGRGAAYTRGRGPVTLLYWEPVEGRGEALRREAALKRLTRAEKLSVVAEGSPLPELER